MTSLRYALRTISGRVRQWRQKRLSRARLERRAAPGIAAALDDVRTASRELVEAADQRRQGVETNRTVIRELLDRIEERSPHPARTKARHARIH